MNLPSDTPRLPKLVFIGGYVALLLVAWGIWENAAHPTQGLALVSIVACVALAAVVIAVPFVADYASRQDEALDNRQRSLQALSVTVASAAEQVSIAATGLQGISEAAQDNFSKFERLSKEIEEKIEQLDARLAAARKDDGEVAARYEAAAKKIARSAGDFEAAAGKAAAAAEAAKVLAASAAAAAESAAAAQPTEAPPVILSKIAEIKPAVLSSDHPFKAPPEAPAAEAPAPLPAPSPASDPEPASAAPQSAEVQVDAPPAPPPPKKRSPRKPPAAPATVDLPLEPTPDEAQAAPAAEASEPAVSADGATRIVVTAYIGIGNRLFIRGEGPGLSWEKGTPLSFVSIGKWRWETNDASSAVRFKLYKNDDAECTALGERSIAPGAQQELTASF